MNGKQIIKKLEQHGFKGVFRGQYIKYKGVGGTDHINPFIHIGYSGDSILNLHSLPVNIYPILTHNPSLSDAGAILYFGDSILNTRG